MRLPRPELIKGARHTILVMYSTRTGADSYGPSIGMHQAVACRQLYGTRIVTRYTIGRILHNSQLHQERHGKNLEPYIMIENQQVERQKYYIETAQAIGTGTYTDPVSIIVPISER